jgi:LmbE family N-acetylglucosaminyl deacetylase
MLNIIAVQRLMTQKTTGEPRTAKPEELRLLCVVAHPADATLAMGAVLARYAAEGVRVYLLTATAGGLDWYGAPELYPGAAEMSRVRRQEAAAAATVLGVHKAVDLGYCQGELDRADPDEAVGRIVAELRRIRPQVVVTFSPDRLYGHPDHVAVSRFTTEAVRAAARGGGPTQAHSVRRLYYLAWTRPLLARYEAAFGLAGPEAEDASTAERGRPLTTIVDASAAWQRAASAMARHESQLAGYEPLRSSSAATQRHLWREVAFEQVGGCSSAWAPVEDLFAAIRPAAQPAPTLR